MCCREPDGLVGACIACLLLVEARAEQQPILALRGVQLGPHAALCRLMCLMWAGAGTARTVRVSTAGAVSAKADGNTNG